jgi:site-specific DNA-methyltransferase (adenine-specific)
MDLVTDDIKLMFGDCLERMKELDSGSIDMILTDPPYGTTACKWDSIIPLAPMWEQLKRIIKPNGAIAMTASQPFTSVLTCSNLKWYKESLSWNKDLPTGHLNANRMHMRKHEDIIVFCEKRPTYNPQKWTSKPMNSSTRKGDGDCYGSTKPKKYGGSTNRFPVSVININTVNNNSGKLHPTQKPVALMEYLIKTYTNGGETVLDFTMGSGTTGVAAVNTRRKFVGIEMDAGYYGISCGRIMDSTILSNSLSAGTL